MTTTNTKASELKINDRVGGTYHGHEYIGVLVAFSGSRFGTFVSIKLDAPITVYGTERDEIGFHLGSPEETLHLVESRRSVRCDFWQGHIYGHVDPN